MTAEEESTRSEDEWRSYRCPVCGHVDEVAAHGLEEPIIRCSHCDTALRVEGDGGRSERLSVRIATDETESEDR